MTSPLFTLYTSAPAFKPNAVKTQKTILSYDKHTFETARATIDFDYHGCYNADDDHADYMPSVKAVRIA